MAATLHPVQAAFKEHHGLQCGFCTPGMIMSAVDMINRHGGKLDEKTVREELEGNICRCTGYHNIVKAILRRRRGDGQGRQARKAAEYRRRANRTDSRGSRRRYFLFEVAIRPISGGDRWALKESAHASRRKEDKRFITGKGRYTTTWSCRA
jgi:hypothetical protein